MTRRKQGYLSILTGELGIVELKKLFLRWGWLPRPTLVLDQGVDLVVELGDGGRGLGIHFNVQSKATRGKIAGSTDGVGVPLTAANVEYLLLQRNPVYLMFVNLPGTEVYWLDAQAALRKIRKKLDGSVYLKVPRAGAINLALADDGIFAERDRFLKALHGSDPLLVCPRVADVSRAVALKEEELQNLDPRFSVRLAVMGDSATYEISAKEEVSLSTSMRFSSPAEAEKAREVFDFGVARTISVESFEVRGSPLFEQLQSLHAGHLTIGGTPRQNVDIYLGSRPRGPQARIRQAIRLRGQLTKGLKGFSIAATAEDYPLVCEARGMPDDHLLEITFQTDVAAWVGKRLADFSDLPDGIEALNNIVQSGELAVGLMSRRFIPNMVHPLSDEMRNCFHAAAVLLAQFDDLRELALRYAQDLRVQEPGRYMPGEPLWWSIARKILQGERAEAPSGSLSLAGDFDPEMKNLIKTQARNIFWVRNAPLAVTACGEVVCTIPIDAMIDGYDVEVIEDVDGQCAIRMRRGADSRLVLRRTSDAPFDEPF